MTDIDSLFTDYVAEHRAGGEADPIAYMERADPGERDELAALIDAYLVRSSGQEWDPEAYKGSPAAAFTEGMGRSLTGSAGIWPVLLPRLRERARVKRSDLVERLATALGVGGEAEQVGVYYHQMEQGQLASEGVSTRVLDALAAIVGSTSQALREAGQAFGEGAPAAGGTVFARTVRPDPKFEGMQSPGTAAPVEASRAADEGDSAQRGGAGTSDEVDRLFTGGD